MSTVGIPVKLLHEAEGHIVTCESTTGEVYRGKLVEAEDNMNCQFANVTITFRDGKVAQLDTIYIRGSKIKFLIVPDMLKNVPIFKNMKGTKSAGLGLGRGKAGMIRGSAGSRGGGVGGTMRGGRGSAGGMPSRGGSRGGGPPGGMRGGMRGGPR